MKKVFLVGTLFVFGALTSQLATAATTAELTLTGQLVPSACDISINGGNSYSLDDIFRSDLNSSGSKTALKQDISKSVEIICAGATFIGIKSFDNHLSSSTNNTSPRGFGLGFDPNGSQIGSYTLRPYPLMMVDDVTAGSITSKDNGVSWRQNNVFFHRDGTALISFDRPSALGVPFAFSKANIPLEFIATINDKDTLVASQIITLSGSATLELHYL